MLDLDPCVHFDEKELAAFRVEDEFHRAGIDVIKCFDQSHSCFCHPFTGLLVEHWRRRFLNKFLMTTLHAAVTFTQMDVIAVTVAEHLNLDMADLREEPLEIDLRVSKRRFGLRRSMLELCRKALRACHNAHSAAAAPSACLQQKRKPEVGCDGTGIVAYGKALIGPGHDRNSNCGRSSPRRHLVSHARDAIAVGADEG